MNDIQQSHKGALPLLVFVLGLLFVAPLNVSAWEPFTSFADRFKTVFLEKKNTEEDVATTQTMPVFKPTVVDYSLTATIEEIEEDQSALKAVSGPMRLSTEDIDFPMNDTISVYEVKKGDTINDVAKLFNVSVNTIIWANNLPSRTIKPGETLIILPVTGIKHTIKKGDTVKTLAKKYKADIKDVTLYNGITEESELAVGDTVIIPDGEIEIAQPKPKPTATKPRVYLSYSNQAPSGALIRPLVGGRRTQGIHGNNGVDIAATPGTPVLASGSGRVIAARVGGYNGGYGNMIIISHDNGVQTVYGHLKDVYVSNGQIVSQGETIGGVGNTGRSTGPHLHFEVRGAKNPF